MPPDSLPASRSWKRFRLVNSSSRSDQVAQIGVEIHILDHRQIFVEAEALGHVTELAVIGLARRAAEHAGGALIG
jgi:hypothetical protein